MYDVCDLCGDIGVDDGHDLEDGSLDDLDMKEDDNHLDVDIVGHLAA